MGAASLQKSCTYYEDDGDDCEEILPASARRMHRILLVSSSIKPFQNELSQLLAPRRRRDRGIKVVCVPDAVIGNGYGAEASYTRVASEFRSFNVSELCCVELRGSSPEQLVAQLRGADCIYCDVGNTFYLRYYMMASGFDKLVSHLIHDEGVVYIGASAGAIAAGRSISTAFWKGWDPPGYGLEWDLSKIGYEGLDLLPAQKSVFPHYASKYKKLVQTKRQTIDHEVVILDETNCYMVLGEEELFVPQPVIVP